MKKHKWNDAYIAYGLHRTKEEKSNLNPSGKCLFYARVFGNSNSAPGHLKKRVKSQHSAHQNKSKAFSEASLESPWRQLSSFENSVVKKKYRFRTCFPENGSYPHTKKTSVSRLGVCSSLSWNYRWHSAWRKKSRLQSKKNSTIRQ